MKFIIVLYLFGVLLANLSNRHARKLGQKGIPFEHTLNPFKWFSVMYGFIIALIIPKHIFIQYAQRVFEKNCQVCLKEGVCTGGLNKEPGEQGCGCSTYAKMMSPFEEDYSNNWGKIILRKSKVKEKLREYPIELKIKIDHEFI